MGFPNEIYKLLKRVFEVPNKLQPYFRIVYSDQCRLYYRLLYQFDFVCHWGSLVLRMIRLRCDARILR